MKLKKSLKAKRTCNSCNKTIARLEKYGQKSKTILSDPKGQCISFDGQFNEANAFPFRLVKKIDFCEECVCKGLNTV